MESGVLMIGIGNEYRGDDGAGLAVARALRASLPPTVTVIEHGGDGASLMDAWRGAEAVILVDAVAMHSDAPGSILRFDAHERPLPSDLRISSTHAFGVAEAIELARSLGELPLRLVLYGIVGQNWQAGATLTPAVAAAACEVAERIAAEIRAIG